MAGLTRCTDMDKFSASASTRFRLACTATVASRQGRSWYSILAAFRPPHAVTSLDLATAWMMPIVLVAVFGCSPQPETTVLDEKLPDSLTEFGLFEGELRQLIPSTGVQTYTINSSSFHDYADHQLVLKLPPGASIEYREDGTLAFPLGTILAQTLSYAHDGLDTGRTLVETRVLLRRSDSWIAAPYLWNAEQTDANLEILGGSVPVSRRLANGTLVDQMHVVPNFNDCKRCHEIDDRMTPIAMDEAQLNCPPPNSTSGESQLSQWRREGVLSGVSAGERLTRLASWNDPSSGTVAQRSRAWLHANCAHCHNPRGKARNSGLQLAVDIEEPSQYGVMKTPVAAGRGSGGLQFDIVPGRPDLSIMLFRVRSTESGIMMPEFGRTQVDEEGVALLSEWIAAMPMSESSPNIAGMVSELSSEEVATWAKEALSEGDAKRGETIFRREALNCTKCHAIRGNGGNVGPDLAMMGNDTKPEHIVESILLPNKVIREGFHSVTVQTTTGEVLTGIQVLDDGQGIVIRDPVRGDTRIAKAEIEARTEGESLMPSQVAATLARRDLVDLVRFLYDVNQRPESYEEGSPLAP
ncbi:MAG: hypothetical protein DWQ37_07455 [Planctomycetota bacterium]|nr:MAG: hypothetical protein DWQ37_07455 [Planctomycetota bacterium]